MEGAVGSGVALGNVATEIGETEVFEEPTKWKEGLVGDGVVLVVSGGGDLRENLLLGLEDEGLRVGSTSVKRTFFGERSTSSFSSFSSSSSSRARLSASAKPPNA